MATRQTRLLLLPACLAAAICLPAVSFVSSGAKLRLPDVRHAAEPQRAAAGATFGSSTFSTAVFTAAAMTAFAGLLRSRVTRHGKIWGWRDDVKKMSENWEEGQQEREPYRNYIYGQRGFKECEIDPRTRQQAPARMALGRVTEALAAFETQDFFRAEFAEIKPSDVKEVGTYTVKAASGETVCPGEVPEYVPIKRGKRLEKEPGFKRPPTDDAGYTQYVDEKCGLYEAAKQVSSKQQFSLDKDIICDRSSLVTLLEYVSENLTGFLMPKGQHNSPVDLVKISKAEDGKALVLEHLLDVKRMKCFPYRGAWKRSEVSNHGTYTPAFRRLAYGDCKTKNLMITGLPQIAGSTAGELDTSYRFVEFETNGVSFLVKAPADAQKDGKNVELAHKNWYYQNEIKALTTYAKMVLGKVDTFVLALQRSGKIHEVVESSPESILEKQPEVEEAANRRLGRVVSLIKQVQDAVAKGDSGPWVLQWQQGPLILGKYELVSQAEQEMVAA
ncbi:unnamed protein product [Symbiodinium sp. CCMP2592]|nr:unnamed protein product [Symbiodinium sp. CCMP2592]